MTFRDTYESILNAYIARDDQEYFKCDSKGFNADFTNTRAGYYAKSEEDMKKELDEFRNFPGAFERFGQEGRAYNLKPVLARTLNQQNNPNSIVFYRQDAFNTVMSQVPFPLKDSDAENVILYILNVYLNYKEMKLQGECQIIEACLADYLSLKEALVKAEKLRSFKITRQNSNIDKVIKQIVEFLKSVSTSIDISLVESKLRRFENVYKFKKCYQMWQIVLNNSIAFIKEIDAFIKARPYYFCLNNYKTPASYRPQLRIFVEEHFEFFLISEILRELEQRKLDGGEFENSLKESLAKDELATISCQKVKLGWESFINEDFKENKILDCPMFMDVDEVERVRTLIIQKVDERYGASLANVEEIRPIGNEGFDYAYLKNQIDELGLDRYDVIMMTSLMVYQHIRYNREGTLTMHDLYDAMEQCQILAYMDDLEMRSKWLDNQEALNRPPLNYFDMSGCFIDPENMPKKSASIFNRTFAQ
ncbi:hypothetical protein CAEBREN_11372 [Caenorhabditis brenneri]|uniref:DUF7809 domain-containing protein n=1 Tax=Caenorhabditis brenneri TaxID=135651 RepID=G0NHW0_CAEBE|nr:hypothetical protein CAEBREN_11372 [Caenorhabditis brenneri]